MLHKLIDSKDKAPDGTDYHDPPIGLRRITEADFTQSNFFMYYPVSIEWRQIFVNSKDDLTANRNGKMIDMQMYWFHDGTGIAIHNDYWGKKVEYFAFGCDHKYLELSQEECRKRGITHHGHCYHVQECDKCHHIESYDSSD